MDIIITNLELAQRVFDVVMQIAIILIFLMNMHWLMKLYLIMNRKSPFLWMGKALFVVCALFVITFLYLLISNLSGTPVYLTSYGVLFIRPIIFLMGSVIGAISRMAYCYLREGGIVWISRKPKL